MKNPKIYVIIYIESKERNLFARLAVAKSLKNLATQRGLRPTQLCARAHRKEVVMTIREMYVELLNVLNENETSVDRGELIQMVEDRLAKHDAQNEKRKNAERKPSAKQLAAAEYDAKLIEALGEILTDEFQLRTVFAEALDITPSKASVLLNKMVAAGTVEKGEVKGEKGKQVGYKRA